MKGISKSRKAELRFDADNFEEVKDTIYSSLPDALFFGENTGQDANANYFVTCQGIAAHETADKVASILDSLGIDYTRA
jgi:hypothetical protein